MAYLGQDDLWHPTHLATAVRTAHDLAADWVVAVMISYGPPESGIRGLSGLFADGAWSPSQWMPPSSVLHHKSFVERIGYWRDPQTSPLAPDCDFFARAVEAGARIASTGEVTAFKFVTGWRRDAFVVKSTSDQEDLLAKIRSGEEFRHSELLQVLRAAVANKLLLLKMPKPADYKAEHFRAYREFKGSAKRYGETELRELRKSERFFLPDDFTPFEWHLEEHHPRFGPFRWSGPLPRASVDLPIRIRAPIAVVVHVIDIIQRRQLETIKLFINGTPIEFKTERTVDNTYRLCTLATPAEFEGESQGLRISIEVDKPQRPVDLGANEDTRWLGVAVNWIEVAPADKPN